jgi:hypothetical protein
MPPLYTVRAQVIDIRRDVPQSTDAFLVDTQVWYWDAYPSATAMPGSATPAQMGVYSAYLSRGAVVGAIAYRTGICLAELTHLIEQNEYRIYAGAVAAVTAKEYRHNLHAERARVVHEVEKAWARVKLQSQPLPVVIDDTCTDAALVRFGTQQVDGHDLFLLEAMSAAGVRQVLTDDGDYCTVPGIQVFTANPRVIAAARSAGLVVTR